MFRALKGFGGEKRGGNYGGFVWGLDYGGVDRPLNVRYFNSSHSRPIHYQRHQAKERAIFQVYYLEAQDGGKAFSIGTSFSWLTDRRLRCMS